MRPVPLFSGVDSNCAHKCQTISLPAQITFYHCVFQEAYVDPYAGSVFMYAIQVPMPDHTWIVHVAQKDVHFLRAEGTDTR